MAVELEHITAQLEERNYKVAARAIRAVVMSLRNKGLLPFSLEQDIVPSKWNLNELKGLTGINQRVVNQLRRKGLTIEDLETMSREDLLSIRRIGPKTVDQLSTIYPNLRRTQESNENFSDK